MQRLRVDMLLSVQSGVETKPMNANNDAARRVLVLDPVTVPSTDHYAAVARAR